MVIGFFLVVCLSVTVVAMLPWRIGKGVFESLMDWVDYDLDALSRSTWRVVKAFMIGNAPNYRRSKS